MRKHKGLSHRRRPNLDALEDRCLLSGSQELPGRPDPPAVVARMVGTRDAAHPEDNHLHPLTCPEDAFHDPHEPVAARAWEGEPRPECDVARFGSTPVANQGAPGRGVRSRDDSENPTVSLALTAPAPAVLSPVSRPVPNERPVITATPIESAAPRSEEKRELTAKMSPEILAESNPAVRRATADPTDPPPGDCAEVPPLRGAGLIAELLPFDRASLEAAVDRFFDRFEDFDMERLGWEDPATMIPPSVALMLAATALEVARRRLRRTSRGGGSVRGRLPEERLSLLGFPELPGPWSTRTP